VADASAARRAVSARPWVLGAIGVLAVVGSQWWTSASLSWLAAVNLVAGLSLAVAGVALLRARMTSSGLLLELAAVAWATTTVGIQTGGLCRALVVHAALTVDLRLTSRGARIAMIAVLSAYVAAFPFIDVLGWPWILVAAVVAMTPRARASWLFAGPVVLMLCVRAVVGMLGLLTRQERDVVVLAYAALVVMSASGAVLTSRAWRADRGRVVTQVIALAGLPEAEQELTALAAAIGDPDVIAEMGPDGWVLRSAVLDRDTALAAAVAEVLALSAANRALRADLAAQLDAVRTSSGRLLMAHDDQSVALRSRVDLGPRATLDNVSGLLQRLDGDSDDVRRRRDRARIHLARAAHGLSAVSGSRVPSLLTGSDLERAIRDLAAGLFDNADVEVSVSSLRPVVATTVWFLCAEGLTNAAKHSGAGHVSVRVAEEEHTVIVDVVDDGVGGADGAGSGLRGIAERVTALGGRFHLTSEVGRGTSIRARMPA
jgi:hypothetical protein